MATRAVPGGAGQFLMKPKASFILKGLIHFSFYVENNGSLFSQFKSSERQSVGLTATTSFTAVMKAAYAQGPSSLLEDAFRKDVEGTLASMLMAEFPVAIKQVLLYIKSTVENLGTVRAQKKLLATTLMTKLKIYICLSYIISFCTVLQKHWNCTSGDLNGNTPGFGDQATEISRDHRL